MLSNMMSSGDLLSAQSSIALLRDKRLGAIGGRPPFMPFARAMWGGGAIFWFNPMKPAVIDKLPRQKIYPTINNSA